MHLDSISSLHLMSFSPITQTQSSQPITLSDDPHFQKLNPKMQHLLLAYPNLFAKQNGLPPSRPHDHHITLWPNTPPINVKHYHYLHSKKETMTKLIAEMLQDGIIIPTHSPYSFPILLVKKKMGHGTFVLTTTPSML